MLADVLENGFPEGDYPKLKDLLYRFSDIFRTNFSSGPPASIPPMVVELTHDARPTVVKLRRYSESQQRFLRKITDKLLDVG